MTKHKYEYAFWTFFVLAVLAAGSSIVAAARSESASVAKPEIYEDLDIFGQVLQLVRLNYVEKPDDEKLIETAINGMLMALDPHSSYMNAREFSDMQVQTRGEFGGLGLEVSMENGLVKVISPMDGTPGAKAGNQLGGLLP